MTSEQYQETIKRLKLSRPAAAKFLGVDETTARRWVSEKHAIPDSVAMLLRLMAVYKITPDIVSGLMQEDKV